VAEIEGQKKERRERRRARQSQGSLEDPKATTTPGDYRASPQHRRAPAPENLAPRPKPGMGVWKMERDACRKELRDHGVSALKSAGLLALGFAALVWAAQQDQPVHTRANSKLGAAGFLLALVAFIGLIRALVLLASSALRLRRIERRKPR
jgi:hypothetical protein